jgi:hypothetical protein
VEIHAMTGTPKKPVALEEARRLPEKKIDARDAKPLEILEKNEFCNQKSSFHRASRVRTAVNPNGNNDS